LDWLEDIFQKNVELRKEIFARKGLDLPLESETWILWNVVALMEELGEFANEVRYHWWRKEKERNYPALREELIDMLHFWLNLAEAIGLDASSIHKLYKMKNKVNFERIRTESK